MLPEPCQGRGRGFESLRPLQILTTCESAAAAKKAAGTSCARLNGSFGECACLNCHHPVAKFPASPRVPPVLQALTAIGMQRDGCCGNRRSLERQPGETHARLV